MSHLNNVEKKQRFNTLVLHGGQPPTSDTRACATPIYQTVAYLFDNTDYAERLFSLSEEGNIYTRIGNPTTKILEDRITLLEEGIGSLATSSGMAAITLAILNLVKSGDEIVASTELYGGTYNLLSHTLPRMGIHTTFVDPSDITHFSDAITPNTKLLYGETLSNPKLNMLDIEPLSQLAHEHQIPLILDNTVTTPYLIQPFKVGADIVVHSATKYLGGHGTTIGGLIVDSGNFGWTKDQFPDIINPDPSYHGISYTEHFGNAAYIAKARVQLLRDLGPALSPFNAFLLLQGIETLPLRMKQHCNNAQAVAEFLKGHPKVAWTNYPGLKDHPTHTLAKKYLQNGFGGIVGFGIKGGKDAGRRFIDNLKLFLHLANIGDAKSLAIHPASTTHQQLSLEERLATGVTEDFVRLCVGIEDIDDIIEDLDNALNQV